MSVVIAAEGCGHGELDRIYASVARMEAESGVKVELLVCCGDFQSLRNRADLQGFSAPRKYHSMGSFHKYYAGVAQAPVLTIFVGGNHEASAFLQELPYGGWVAPKIFFLGTAGVVRFRGLRIAGMSGIFNERHFSLGRFERPPYNAETLRSVYHCRALDAFRLQCLRRPAKGPALDVFVSHDWPAGISMFGDHHRLLQRKKFLREEVYSGTLGSPAGRQLLQTLRPRYWFAAHLHVKFAAVVEHRQQEVVVEEQAPRRAGQDGGDGGNEASEATKEDCEPELTRFLALDKCLRQRDFLQLLHIDSSVRKSEDEDASLRQQKASNTQVDATESQAMEAEESEETSPGLCYDLEWLAVLRKTWSLETGARENTRLPAAEAFEVSDGDIEQIRAAMTAAIPPEDRGHSAEDDIRIPQNFEKTATPDEEAGDRRDVGLGPLRLLPNPQTDFLLNALELPHIITVPCDGEGRVQVKHGKQAPSGTGHNGAADDSEARKAGEAQESTGDHDENEIDV